MYHPFLLAKPLPIPDQQTNVFHECLQYKTAITDRVNKANIKRIYDTSTHEP